VFCAVIDDAAGTVCYSSAGHPWAIVDNGIGHVMLTEAQSAPLGVRPAVHRREAYAPLPPGSTLLAYTDGLVEREGELIDVGIRRAATVLAENRDVSAADVADVLASRLLAPGLTDDVAFLVYRQPAGSTEPLSMMITADTMQLAELLGPLRGWLRAGRIDPETADDLLVAAGEIVTNAIEHGTAAEGDHGVYVTAERLPGQIIITVRDQGRWHGRNPAAGRGRGLIIAEALVNELTIDTSGAGTSVRLMKKTR
jgi:anti-sigma regulatory factor (Ser/Thr protein kinase)